MDSSEVYPELVEGVKVDSRNILNGVMSAFGMNSLPVTLTVNGLLPESNGFVSVLVCFFGAQELFYEAALLLTCVLVVLLLFIVGTNVVFMVIGVIRNFF